MDTALFSPDYVTARTRFCSAAQQCGAILKSYLINQAGPHGEPLSIDVAIADEGDASRCLLLSSGMHGVEGYFGSAVQLGMLTRWAKNPDTRPRHRWVMIHAINPYGMAWHRRFNEDNVDLNRNFLLEGEVFEGAPDGYERFYTLLNPARRLSSWEPLKLKFALAAIRYGHRRIQSAVSSGQYDHPKGLFFGGRGPARSHQIFLEQFTGWLGDAGDVMHIDFHSGLGRHATYQMLIDHSVNQDQLHWLNRTFGRNAVCAVGPGSVSSVLRGSFGIWGHQQAGARNYIYSAAEFGTCSILEVVAALRTENQCTHWEQPGSVATRQARARVLEAFCPASLSWRRRVAGLGMHVVEQALEGLRSV